MQRILLAIALCAGAASVRAGEPTPFDPAAAPPAEGDWLVGGTERRAEVFKSADGKELILDNGLLRRRIRIEPNAATVGLENLRTGTRLLRAANPEVRLKLDGQWHDAGGLVGQPDRGFLKEEWLDEATSGEDAWTLRSFEATEIVAPFPWKRSEESPALPWPPPGVSLAMTYRPPERLGKKLELVVVYDLYDSLPAMGKRFALKNLGDSPATLDSFELELLSLVEADSAVDERRPEDWERPLVHMQSDYAFSGMDHVTSDNTAEWRAEPEYATQVNYNLKTPCLLVSRPPVGPGVVLRPGETFESYRSVILLHDDWDRERRGLAVRRMQRALAPWTTDNPLMMHVRGSDRETFRRAADQCAEVGFEMIVYTFGSGLNMESEDPFYIKRIAEDVAYAHAKGLRVGAYSLLASRSISPEHDAINPDTGKPGGMTFGNSPCLCSEWGQRYFEKLGRFIEATNLDLLEHDGSYPGDVCASEKHPGHLGLADSQWMQWKAISEFYRWCRARDVYLNVPDYYFLAGSNKTGMGYRETNWSLPRELQLIHGRRNIYDGTWTKSPSMGWMFVPLVEYHGGGAAATLEPLRDHLDDYERHLVNNLAFGVQACYRGPRLYDSDETKEMVARWVSWFKEWRPILESELIHVRRADGRGIDAMLHVDPSREPCGMLVAFNPLDEHARTELTVPLYYTGLTDEAWVGDGYGISERYELKRDYSIDLEISIPARGFAWYPITAKPLRTE